MRLDELLLKHGYPSRKSIKQLLKQNSITIDGLLATSGRQNVDPNLQLILVNGKRIVDYSQVYYLLNKPQGYVTAVKDKYKPTVLELIQPQDNKEGLYHIGRLDASTEGLLLITNNGPLGLRLLHPDYHISKVYLAEVNAALDWRAVVRFDQGIVFRDGKRCKPAKLEILESRLGYSRALVTISEGKFHQVKKMFLAVGVKVTYLKRIKFGPFELSPNLPVGHYRPLTPEELDHLKQFLD